MNTEPLDLFARKIQLSLPERVLTFGRVEKSFVRRIAPAQDCEVSWSDFPKARGFRCVTTNGFSFAIVAHNTTSRHGCDAVLKVSDVSSQQAVVSELRVGGGKWILPRPAKPKEIDPSDVVRQIEDSRASWLDALESDSKVRTSSNTGEFAGQ
jgi:hypothetical protein